MRLLVFGGRDYADSRTVYWALDQVKSKHGIDCVIHGGAKGADRLGASWAENENCPTEEYEADWERFGKGAGPRRNQQMIDEGKPDAAVGFPGEQGTLDMAKRLHHAGIPCWWPVKDSCPI